MANSAVLVRHKPKKQYIERLRADYKLSESETDTVAVRIGKGEDYYMLVGMNQGKYNLEESSKAEQGNMKDDASADNAKYVNLEYPAENRTFEIGALKQQIKDEHEKRPNYREERAQKEAEIQERNKELFGE